MTTLHFGYNQILYPDGKKTTEDVGRYIEAEYKLLETFFELNEDAIISNLVKSYTDALDAIMDHGADPNLLNPIGDAASFIEKTFKLDLSQKAFDGVIPGVPTQASLGHSKRRKRRRKTLAVSRPSFINSGLFQSSFTVWVDNVSSDVSE